MRSSPGYPLMRQFATNAVLFKPKGEWDAARLDYVWGMVSRRLETLQEADPIRLFVKPEPHKKEKIETGRYRLISSVALVDQIIDHMLFDSMNSLVPPNWLFQPVKCGWSPLAGGWKFLPPKPMVAIDRSSWDWTVQPWLLEMMLEVRAGLCQTVGPLFEKWLNLAQYRYTQLFARPLFITSGGTLLRQANPGVMKSGCVNTIVDNSIQQWLLHSRVLLEHGLPVVGTMWCMGDDTLQSSVPEDYEAWLSEYSIVKERINKVEFAGFLFEGRVVEPIYFGKHAFNLLYLNPDVEADVALSYALLYHRSRNCEFFREMFAEMGLETFSRSYSDAIFDGEW
nr:hypothetical protein 2 [Virus sp.]